MLSEISEACETGSGSCPRADSPGTVAPVPTNTSVPTSRVSIHGHQLTYRAAGSGPAIVLIHGMAGSGATWEAVAGPLAESFTVIAPDLPGHGASDKPSDGDYSLGAFASSVRDLMVMLGHERATIVGQSLGGGVAMQFAYQFPSRCERLVLVGSGGLGREVNPMLRALTFPGIDYLFPILFAPAVRTAGRSLFGGLARVGLRPSTYVDQIWRGYESLVEPSTRAAFSRTLRSVVDIGGQKVNAHDRLPLAADIPTLIVWGERDSIIPSRHAHDAHATLPTSRVEIFDGVGHFPHCEDSERFRQVLDDFMRSTEPARLTDEHFAHAIGPHNLAAGSPAG